MREGESKKFVSSIEQITFSGDYGIEKDQSVLYVTERAVFSLEPQGLVLQEIAPGIDLKKDILNQMEFKPIVSSSLKIMDSRIFGQERMNIECVSKGYLLWQDSAKRVAAACNC